MTITDLELHTAGITPYALSKDLDDVLERVKNDLLAAVRSDSTAVYRIQITKEANETT